MHRDSAGIVALSLDFDIQLDKASAGTGTMTFTLDFSAPFDCADGEQTTGDLTLTPLPQSHDEDLDGCADWEELGSAPGPGGLRDPFNGWDFFDTPGSNNVRDKAISTTDIARVVGRFGTTGDPSIDPLSPPATGYHTAFDRGATLGPNTWNRDAADGAIATTDIAAVTQQFGHSCIPAP